MCLSSVLAVLVLGQLAVTEVQLRAPDPASGDVFGSSVVARDGALFIGMHGADHSGRTNAGAVVVFEPTEDGSWAVVQTVTASEPVDYGFFGRSLDVDGTSLVVGASGCCAGGSSNQAAHVFDRGADGLWREVQALTPKDAGSADHFGVDVAVDGDVLVVGADEAYNGTGSAYVYRRRPAGRWELEQRLTPGHGLWWRWFGFAVDVEDQTIVVGAPAADDSGLDGPGAVHVFIRVPDGDWREVQELRGSAVDTRHFGYALDLDRERILVGAPRSSSAFVFVRDGRLWRKRQVLAVPSSHLGAAVELAGPRAVIGASSEMLRGAVHLYAERGDGSWAESARITASDGVTNDHLGAAVALIGSTVVAANPSDGDVAWSAGSVYLFTPRGSPGETFSAVLATVGK